MLQIETNLSEITLDGLQITLKLQKMAHKIHAIESDIFNHFRQEEIDKKLAIILLKKSGYIVYKRSEKSPRIYETLGVSKLINK